MTLALAPSAASLVATRPFASVDVFADPAAARAPWSELAPFGSAYQSPRFAEDYAAAFGVRLVVAVARDASGAAVAVLPLQIRRLGVLTVASLVGGTWANYHLGLFRPGVAWSAGDVAAMLRAAGRRAGIDLFAFSSLPSLWEGREHPLSRLPGAPSPSAAFASRLPASHGEWFDARMSRASQKKLRKKLRKLEAFGAVRHVRAGGDDAGPLLDAFLAHKAAQAAARGEPDLFAQAPVRDLLRRLLASGAMEMHALLAGERVAACFGALPGGRRLSGLVVSYDGAPDVAAASPGEWLLIEVARDAIARGFDAFDLGVGDSRYKRDLCEIEEPLRDAALGVTALGRLAALAYLGGRAAKGYVKRRPALFDVAKRLRRAI